PNVCPSCFEIPQNADRFATFSKTTTFNNTVASGLPANISIDNSSPVTSRPIVNQANLKASCQYSIDVTTSLICVPINLSNDAGTFFTPCHIVIPPEPLPYSGAGSTFIAVLYDAFIDPQTITLNGTSPNLPLPSIIGQYFIFNVGDLAVGTKNSIFNLCFKYITCGGGDLKIYCSYTCNKPVPSSMDFNPLSTSDYCLTPIAMKVSIKDVLVKLDPNGNTTQVDYKICNQNNVYTSKFIAFGPADIVPTKIEIANLPTGVTVTSCTLKKPNGPSVPLSTAGLNQFNITSANLAIAQYANSVMNGTSTDNEVYFEFKLEIPCGFVEGNYDLTTILYNTNYCGTTSITTNNASQIFFHKKGSDCTDCFAITKTIDNNPVKVGDPVVFTITVCADNATAQLVNIGDVLPKILP
nr:hypothetical protein [Bacteroidota bacterium]